MVVDMKKMSGVCPAIDAGLQVGDVIETVNGEAVYSNMRISELIRASGGDDCTIGFRRGGESLECTLTPVFSAGSYRAGMWVRDSSAGIGTMTFIDPDSGAFAGLGHSICDPDTREPLPLSQGTAAEVRIDGVTKSARGIPGQLLGEFDGGDIGRLTLNCEGGVYGVIDSLPENAQVYPLGFTHEVRKGDAYMIAQLDGGSPQRFNITVESVDSGGHDLIIRTDDSRLIEQAGGIVQGMSGSPIIQDGRLIGAVTHVFIDDPCGGYGIYAERMYKYAVGAAAD
jgi:stage IV sporulation protein B